MQIDKQFENIINDRIKYAINARIASSIWL